MNDGRKRRGTSRTRAGLALALLLMASLPGLASDAKSGRAEASSGASSVSAETTRNIIAALQSRHRAAAEAAGSVPSPGHVTAPAKPGRAALASRPDPIWEKLLQGNRRFVSGQTRTRELRLTRGRLVEGQHPQAIVLGCSDSRCPPELLFDQNLGDVFVIRTAGNVADSVALASIEYAIEHLHSGVLVVLGHEKCGAVAAAASGEPMPTRHLETLIGRVRASFMPLRGIKGDDLARLGVEANVRRSAADLLSMSGLIREAVDAGKVRLVQALYRLDGGDVVTLH